MHVIKNRKELLKEVPKDLAHRRRVLFDIADYVLQECAPEKLLKGTFPSKDLKKFEKIAIFAIGKAGRSMAKALLPLLGRKPDYCLVADKGHPLPAATGLQMTQKIEKIARGVGEKDLAIVLISGGGSAMFVDPVDGITLADKVKTTQALLKCGATINEVNSVRKHLSRVKGGRLAELLYPATVWGFVISDVIGNDLSTIASGPLSPDPTTFQDALRVLKKYKVTVPTRIQKYLEKGSHTPELETPKSNAPYFKKVTLEIIADHTTSAKLAFEKATQLGLNPKIVIVSMSGEARISGPIFIIGPLPMCAPFPREEQPKRHDLLIGTGETTVTCVGTGYGGRNQEFVLSTLSQLKKNQIVLSIGTDGVDGVCPEEVAGAVGDSLILDTAREKNLSIVDHLKNNDSYTFFKKAGGLIKTGPTGTNLGDLVLLLS